jgi:hypothetical protein
MKEAQTKRVLNLGAKIDCLFMIFDAKSVALAADGNSYGAVHLCTTNFVQMPIHWQNFLNFTLLQRARFYSETDR